MAGSEAIHVVEKVEETGLLRHFVPRNDGEYFDSLLPATLHSRLKVFCNDRLNIAVLI